MSNLIWLSEAQMRRIEPYFPLSHGVPRVDDRRVVSGKYGSIRRICASDNQIRSLMAAPPCTTIESINHRLSKRFNRS